MFDVPLTVGGTAGRALLDTGAPITVIDPAAFPAEAVPSGYAAGPDVGLSDLRFTGPKMLGSATGASLGTTPVTAILGGDLLCHFESTLDYRGGAVRLGPADAPANVEAPVALAAQVRGGGLGQVQLGNTTAVLQFPPTRLLVSATVDGAVRRFLVDTGASMTVLSKAAFDALVLDGRRTLSGLSASTVMGTLDVRLTRVRALALGELVLGGTLVASLDDPLWAGLAQETGQQIDGLLGGTALREALVQLSYADERLTLRRYTSRAHVHDELIRVGVTLGALTSGGYAVSSVFAGSDAAAKGLAVGTVVLAVDGQALAALRPTEVDLLLRGAVGSTKQLRTQAATVDVSVEDLLPL